MQQASYAHTKNAEFVCDFVSSAARKRFAPKATIVGQGDVSRDLFFIVSGSVTFRLDTLSGHDFALAMANAGEFFGETGLFETAAVNGWRVRARTVCDVAFISHAQLHSQPRLRAGLWPMLTAQLAARLDTLQRKTGEMAFCDALARVASALRDLANAPDARPHADGRAISVTRVELAAMTGASREAVGRILMRLEQQGTIRVKGRSMIVLAAPECRARVMPLSPAREYGRVSAMAGAYATPTA